MGNVALATPPAHEVPRDAAFLVRGAGWDYKLSINRPVHTQSPTMRI